MAPVLTSRFSIGEISFLLGFEEPNSFFRAFGEWTGRTPETVRRAAGAFGWWWADPAAALVIAGFLTVEGVRVAIHHRFG